MCVKKCNFIKYFGKTSEKENFFALNNIFLYRVSEDYALFN